MSVPSKYKTTTTLYSPLHLRVWGLGFQLFLEITHTGVIYHIQILRLEVILKGRFGLGPSSFFPAVGDRESVGQAEHHGGKGATCKV